MKTLLLLLIVLSLFFPNNISAHSQVQVVEMTSDGFSPQEITIDESSSIIFVNKDKEAHWPASNPHPVHSIYPQFDPRKPIQTGESWPFKPKVGTFRYHDHLSPHLRGVIIVVAEKGIKKDEVKKEISISFIEKVKNTIGGMWTKIKNSLNFLKKQNPPVDIKKFIKLSGDDQM